MKYRLIVVWCMALATLMVISGSAHGQYTKALNDWRSVDAQSMIAVLDHYCQSIDPVSNCGVYQHEINQAQLRAGQMMVIVESYSAGQKTTVLDALLERVSRAFYTTSDTNTKVIAAFYYVYFSQQRNTLSGDGLFGYLFENGNTIREYSAVSTQPTTVTPVNTGYRSSQGYIQNVWSRNSSTRVNSGSKSLSVNRLYGSLHIGVKAMIQNNVAKLQDGYRLVAQIDGRSAVYGGNYQSDGSWEFSLGNTTIRNADQITFSLICSHCSGTKFHGNVYSDWKLIDTVTYSIDSNTRYDRYGYDYDYNDRYNRRYDYRYDDNYHRDYDDYYYGDVDLGLTNLEYEYELTSGHLSVDLVAVIRNYDRDLARIDEIDYTIAVEGDRLSSSEYTMRHVTIECDDTRTRVSSGQRFSIEGYDECKIHTEIRLDKSDIRRNDYVTIDVELISDDDRNRGNNQDRVSFRIDDYWRYY